MAKLIRSLRDRCDHVYCTLCGRCLKCQSHAPHTRRR